ncbi:MAG: hypothetical protein WBQ26_15080 [Gemmatimonadaceae bacterium]
MESLIRMEWSEVGLLLLAVEVLSPSSARLDRGLKREFYVRAPVDEYSYPVPSGEIAAALHRHARDTEEAWRHAGDRRIATVERRHRAARALTRPGTAGYL